jgi:transposase
MSAPLPDALRVRFQKLIEEELSGRAAALRLKLSPATGARWSFSIRRAGQARAASQFFRGNHYAGRRHYDARTGVCFT